MPQRQCTGVPSQAQEEVHRAAGLTPARGAEALLERIGSKRLSCCERFKEACSHFAHPGESTGQEPNMDDTAATGMHRGLHRTGAFSVHHFQLKSYYLRIESCAGSDVASGNSASGEETRIRRQSYSTKKTRIKGSCSFPAAVQQQALWLPGCRSASSKSQVALRAFRCRLACRQHEAFSCLRRSSSAIMCALHPSQHAYVFMLALVHVSLSLAV